MVSENDDDGRLLDLSSAIDLLDSLSTPSFHFDGSGKYHGLPSADLDLGFNFDLDIDLDLHDLNIDTPVSSALSLQQQQQQPPVSPQLGNFSNVWNFLGATPDSPTPLALEDENKAPTQPKVNVAAKTQPQPPLQAQKDKETRVKRKAAVKQKQKSREATTTLERARDDDARHRSSSSSNVETDNDLKILRRTPTPIHPAVVHDYDICSSPFKPIYGDRDGATSISSTSPPEMHVSILSYKEYPHPSFYPTPVKHDTYMPWVHPSIQPIIHQTTYQRKATLLGSLMRRHPQELPFLKQADVTEPDFTKRNVHENGIHVFIDASNIMIGFHDSLKTARDIPISTHIRRAPFDFHNLSLILERGRPTAKRVLVGSDNFPAIQDAKDIGYETNILERVHKAKEITPRPKKFRNAGTCKHASALSGCSSGSETIAAADGGEKIFAPERWVEQAVDEILHLKILESIVDAEKPSTIVLATGDAAEAEYSQGFLKMVERALEKGWMVELVSFRLNTSGAYRRKDFRAKWGIMFKTIELDDYTELLLNM